MQKFIEFESIITELCSVLYSTNILIQLATSRLVLDQQFIFCNFFANNLKSKGDSVLQ